MRRADVFVYIAAILIMLYQAWVIHDLGKTNKMLWDVLRYCIATSVCQTGIDI